MKVGFERKTTKGNVVLFVNVGESRYAFDVRYIIEVLLRLLAQLVKDFLYS